jgi:acyl carrier protein
MTDQSEREAATPAAGTLPPAPDLETVRRVWSTVLGTEVTNLDVGFFEAGGHSLLLMVLQGRLEGLAGREIPIEDLFEHVTVRAQAALLAMRGSSA